jgi:hypothetical protein
MTRPFPLPSKAAWLAPFAAQLALLCLHGCGGEPKFGPEHAVDASKRPTVFGSTQRERFGLDDMSAAKAGAGAAAVEQFEGDAPADWQQISPAEKRQLNYRVGGSADAECYLTSGDLRGDPLSIANRWVAQQFGQTPLTAAQFAALPRHVLLGQPATLVTLEGSFQGMGAAQARAGFKMLALVGGEDDLATLKLVGPKAIVDAQRDAFVAFAASLHRVVGKPAAPPAAGGGDAGYQALTPPGWRQVAPAPMRTLNWRIDASPDAECYLTTGDLRGDPLSIANRWVASQFSQTALTAAQFAALPRHVLLGQPATLVTLEGTFQGMGGAPARPDFKMLGLVGGDGALATLKLIGPKAIVDAQSATFLRLAESIRRGGQSPAPPGPTPPANGAANPHAGDAAAPFAATIPAGWTAAGDSGSKLLRHRFGTEGDCYVGMLGNDLPALLGIWCGDLGAKAPDAAAIAALPRVPMLGGEAVLLDVSGDYKSMSGQTIAGARLLIAARQIDGGVTFAKCIGTAAEVDAQRAAFLAFVASLKRTGQ